MASPLTRIAQYIVQRMGPTPQTGINKDDPQATLHVGGNIISDGAIGAEAITATTLAADTIVGQTIQATVAFQGGNDTWLGYATSTLSGVLSAVAQSIAGLKTFVGGSSSVEYVGTNPEVGGSTPFQLLSSHKRVQVISPAGAITVKLPSSNILAGEVVRIVNNSDQVVTVQSSGAQTIETFRDGFVEIVALVNAPTAATGWLIRDVSDRGSWTPTITTDGTNFSSITYTQQRGYFERRRNTVAVELYVAWNNTAGVPTGNLYVGNIPFTIRVTYFGSLAVSASNIVPQASRTYMTVEVPPGDTKFQIVGCGASIAASGIVAASNGGAAGRYIIIGGTYQCA